MSGAGARLRSALFHAAARHGGGGLAALVRLLSATWRWEVAGEEHLAEARVIGRGILYCFWHGRMLELAAAHARRGIGVLVSTHPDGLAAARIVAPLGYLPIRVSRPGNPVPGVRAMLRHAAAGGDLGLAPDAHRDGHRVHAGAIAVARRSGHAIVPVAAGARPARRIASWDRFEVPWPGARVLVRYGPALVVPPDADDAAVEHARRTLESSLLVLHAQVERELEGAPRRLGERARALQRR